MGQQEWEAVVRELEHKTFRDWHERGVLPETQEIYYEGADGERRRFSPQSCRQAFDKYELRYNETIATEIKKMRGMNWMPLRDIALILLQMNALVQFAKTKDQAINKEIEKVIAENESTLVRGACVR